MRSTVLAGLRAVLYGVFAHSPARSRKNRRFGAPQRYRLSSTSTSARQCSSRRGCSPCATTTSKARRRCTSRSTSTPLLDEMDEQGVRKAILMNSISNPSNTVVKAVQAHPDRFTMSMGGFDLLRPVAHLRELTAMVADLPISYATVGPSFGATVGIRRVMPSTIRCTPSAPNSNCRFASTPGSPVHRSPARCRTDPSRPGVRAVPRTQTVHDPRRRPVVGRNDPDAHQVPEPAADDVCVVAQTPARQPAALHAHPRAEQGDLRLGLAGSVPAQGDSRGT